MNIPVRRISWEPSWRIIPTRYPEARILEKVSANLNGDLRDIRGMRKKLPQVYSRTSCAAAQELADRLVKESSYGIAYDSVRHQGGQCAAVLRPPVLSRCRPERHLIFEWDGKKIARVYELHEYS